MSRDKWQAMAAAGYAQVPPKPEVNVGNSAAAAEWLRAELGRGKLTGILNRGDSLVHTPRIDETGYLPPKDLGLIDAGPAQVRQVTTIAIKAIVEAEYECFRLDTKTHKQIPALFPPQSAQSACEAARLGEYASNLKTLRGITHTPMMRRDGTILDMPGYDTTTGFLYLPDQDLRTKPVPDQPTQTEVQGSVELIKAAIREFPFIDDNDRVNWVGLLFTPALRPLLPGPYPMGVHTATNSGSGKTLLVEMIRIVHGGVLRGELPREADELRKSITAILMDTTAPVVTFDNLTGVVRSSVLESLLTSTSWSDRWLGQNRSVTAPNDRLWLATGNNAQFGGDLARRHVTVRLDPPGADPYLRRFAIKDLKAWTRTMRGDLLAAILTIARAWVVAGKPSEEVRSDDYAEWAGGMRGMLRWAGFPGTFGHSDDVRVVSADDEEWKHFLVALHDVFDDKPFTVKEIVAELRSTHPLLGSKIDQAALPGELAEKWARVYEGRDGGFRKSLGWWLRNRLGRYADGWSVVANGSNTAANAVQYVIRPPSHPGFSGFHANGKSPDTSGFLGFSGSEPPIAKTVFQNHNMDGEGAGGQWPGDNPRNLETRDDETGDDNWLRNMPGRCQECGWHVAAQGHAAHCGGLVEQEV